VEQKTRSIPGVGEVTIDVVWDPPWGPEHMSEAARLELGVM
jgi:metal-sulfur cluster biosynthetic enzyme